MSSLIKNNKAQSSVVVMMFLIILIIAAIALIAAQFDSFFQKAQLSPEISCPSVLASPPISIETACFNKSSNETQITIKKDLSNLTSTVLFAITSGSKTSSFSCGSENCDCTLPNEGESKTYYFPIKDSTEIMIRFATCNLATKEITNFC